MWLVGIWLVGGTREHRVFDNYMEARDFMYLLVDGVYRGVAVDDVALWEM